MAHAILGAQGVIDADVADIANHERSSWGNHARPVTADQVQAHRAAAP